MLTLLLACTMHSAPETSAALRYARLERGSITIVDGGEARKVAGSDGAESFAWDRDGEHLLVTRGARLERLHVSSAEVELVTDAWPQIRMPDVSPDGAQIVFAASSSPPPAQDWKVVTFDRAAGTSRVLGAGYDPCFSRDGAHVLCERHPERDLWSVELASGVARRVFEPPADRYTVQADPFGARVAFSSERRLVVRDLVTGVERTLSPAGVYARFASFAPDRSHILYFRESSTGSAGALRGIREFDLASGEDRALADGDLAAYAPPTLASFLERARIARGSGPDPAPLPIDAQRDPGQQRWFANRVRESGQPFLVLPDVVELAPCEAHALSCFTGDAIFLPNLATLDAPAAALLARFRGSLFLDGLRSIDVATADALAQWRGNGEQVWLSLDGLGDPRVAVLGALARCRGWGLSLDGITRLSPAAAQALEPLRVAYVDLDGITEIEPATAAALAQWHAKFLSLRGWRAPDPESLRLVNAGCAELITR